MGRGEGGEGRGGGRRLKFREARLARLLAGRFPMAPQQVTGARLLNFKHLPAYEWIASLFSYSVSSYSLSLYTLHLRGFISLLLGYLSLPSRAERMRSESKRHNIVWIKLTIIYLNYPMWLSAIVELESFSDSKKIGTSKTRPALKDEF